MAQDTDSQGERPIDLPWVLAAARTLLVRGEQLPHALLITGGAGLGKSAFARVVAQSLLCERAGAGDLACGRCDACRWVGQGNHPDLRWLEPRDPDDAEAARTERGTRARREIKIDQVRALADFVGIGAHRGGRRVIGIDPADALNAIAANALLKTLEEPTPGVHFLLVAERAELLPATIRSRTVAFPIEAPARPALLEWLAAASGRAPAEAVRWLALAGGSPLGALGFAEPERAAAHQALVEAISRLPETSAMSVADAIAPMPAAHWLPVLHTWVVDLGRVCAGAGPSRHPASELRLRALADRVRLPALLAFARWLSAQRPMIEHPLNARLFCEDALIRYTAVFEKAPR